MQLKKARILTLLLSVMLALGACGSATKPTEESSKSTSEAASGETSNQEASQAGTNKAAEGAKVVMLCDPVGTQPFVLSLKEGLEKGTAAYGYRAQIVESADADAYDANARAILKEGVDLLIGGTWQAGDAISKMAQEFPDSAAYAIIDTTVEAKNVKSVTYHEQEAAYLIGKIAALITEPDEKVFGMVNVNEGPGSWKWRWGYMEGVKSVKPDATFLFNYVGSYSDPAKAKEYAIQQYEQGARFINAAAAGGDSGVLEAAKEKGFYTSGQDIDLTSPDNPWVVTGQIKDAANTVEQLIKMYHDGWTEDDVTLDLASGAVGALYITHETPTPRNPKFTDEMVQQVKEAAEKIKSGELNLKDVPAEADYK